MLVLPRDAGRLGISPDELEVAEAVRMSMSIPIFFKPVIRTNNRRDHVLVDGGLLSNFPVWLFDAPTGTQPAFPTLGLLLVAPGQRDPLISTPPTDAEKDATRSMLGYLKSLADTAMQAHDRFYVEDEDFARTIPIPTLGVKTTEFDITPQCRDALLDSGRTAATTFLASWDFQEYIAKYRKGQPEMVAAVT
jgi:NTE family protein